MRPLHPIAAATHIDPYPYYRELAAGPALAFDAGLGLWLASRADVIGEVLANEQCRVRPVAEAVPKALAGSCAGAVFGGLIRMNDGPAHACGKGIIGHALAGVDSARVRALTGEIAGALAERHDLADGAALTRWIFALPTHVLAAMLGVARAERDEVAIFTQRFVQCLSPLATPREVDEAGAAAAALLKHFGAAPGAPIDLLGEVGQSGWPNQEVMLANVIGLLSQTHEATAGLIGNCIVRLLTQPPAGPIDIAGLVREVMRCDPPIQNTRRFVAADTVIAGQQLAAGDTILLLLAADERGHGLGFGHGRHACPGSEVATLIATSALSYLLAVNRLPARDALDWRYRPSVNARLPLFQCLPSRGTS